MNTETTEKSFRDSISTVNADGKRVYIHPRKPKGKYTNWRNFTGVFLLILLISFPLIKINGEPMVMINFLERKFIIFGAMFWPQDTFVLLLMTISFLVFILLFTTTFGRLFCGWTCPQTIFLEIVFRRIEYWIDGDSNKQRKLKEMPWNAEKISKRILKHSIFILLSISFVNIILWYFMGFDKWLRYANEPGNHVVGLFLIGVFSFVFYFIYSWFREQICLIACPYGRMQGVLVDRNTIMVAYDYIRGEKRGNFRKEENRKDSGKGDCVDCKLCVDVCPTGIDIRNGTQLECVNCTACIDVCDSTMKRFNLPKGLIRYASENSIANSTKNHFSARTIAYSVLLTAILTFFIWILATRSPVEATILRTPGSLASMVDSDTISNLYNIKVVNKTHKDQHVTLKLIDQSGNIKLIGENLELKKEARTESVLFVYIHKKEMKGKSMKVKIGVYMEGEKVDETKVAFIAP